MNSEEAKFLLRARRPGGRDAADPMFAEALEAAERDPKLKAWHEREERFDAAVAAKLSEIAPPAELRAAILAGARASVRWGGLDGARGASVARWWRKPGWLAVAAAVAVLMSVAVWFARERGPTVDELAMVALQDLAHAHERHEGWPRELGGVQARLASLPAPMTENLALDLDELKKRGCRSLRIAGREAFEICFQRDGVWYHLYAMRGGRNPAGGLREGEQADGERLVVASWSDARNSYALVTAAGREALRRVL